MNSNIRRQSLRHEIAIHVLRGPLTVLYQPDGDWLDSDISLRRSQFPDIVEDLSLFLPASESLPATSPPLIRKSTWLKSHDMEEDSHPTVYVTYSTVATDAFTEISEAVSRLDRALTEIQWPVDAFSIGRRYQEDSESARRDQAPTDVTHSNWEERSLTRRLTDCFIDLSFNEWSQNGEFSSSWYNLWELLEALSNRNRINEGEVREHYTIAPQVYARLIESLT